MATTSRSAACACGVAVETPLGQACNEEAFRHFLTREHNRWRRSGRPFLLVLVRLKHELGTPARMDAAVAEKVFSCLWMTLRTTDQVGWFREGRVIGAMLGDVTDAGLADALRDKVRSSLAAGLPSDMVARLRVRAFQPPMKQRDLR